MTKLTSTEAKALRGILDSDFMDGETAWPGVGKDVWTWSANPFSSRRTFSGAVSSLVKKGLAMSVEDGADSTIRITREGFDAIIAFESNVQEITGEKK